MLAEMTQIGPACAAPAALREYVVPYLEVLAPERQEAFAEPDDIVTSS